MEVGTHNIQSIIDNEGDQQHIRNQAVHLKKVGLMCRAVVLKFNYCSHALKATDTADGPNVHTVLTSAEK
jgi:hypothetical protein